jgi:nickel-dependent lactate racemase
MHVSADDAAMVKIGTLPSGGECIVNRIAAEADLLLAQGFAGSIMSDTMMT